MGHMVVVRAEKGRRGGGGGALELMTGRFTKGAVKDAYAPSVVYSTPQPATIAFTNGSSLSSVWTGEHVAWVGAGVVGEGGGVTKHTSEGGL
jgi:hypothetical protein